MRRARRACCLWQRRPADPGETVGPAGVVALRALPAGDRIPTGKSLLDRGYERGGWFVTVRPQIRQRTLGGRGLPTRRRSEVVGPPSSALGCPFGRARAHPLTDVRDTRAYRLRSHRSPGFGQPDGRRDCSGAARSRGVNFRTVHVLLFDDDNRVLLRRLAATRDRRLGRLGFLGRWVHPCR